MYEIEQMVASLVQISEAVKGAKTLVQNNGKIVGVCPQCGAEVVEREKGWFCSDQECRFVIWRDNAFFKRLGKHVSVKLVDQLLRWIARATMLWYDDTRMQGSAILPLQMA